jgi:RNA polymerase sigma factor (sigma-70 family)
VGLFNRLRGQTEGSFSKWPEAGQGGIYLELGSELSARLQRVAERRGQPAQILAQELLADGLDQALRHRHAQAALDDLTPRQQQVAQLTLYGYTNRQIADALVVSPETVKTHVRHVLEKFDAASKADLRLRLLDLRLRWWDPEA